MSSDFDDMYGDLATPATRYDNDAISHPTPITLVMTNARNLLVVGARGDRLLGRVPSTTQILAGQVLHVPSLGSGGGWYLVGTVLQRSRSQLLDAGLAFSLLALPYVLTVRRADTPATPAHTVLDSYGAPKALDSGGHPAGITEETFTIRAGFANEFNLLTDAVGGVLPAALETIYTSLGSGLRLDDEVTLPDGRLARVQTLNGMDADGTLYALQGILATSVGSGY